MSPLRFQVALSWGWRTCARVQHVLLKQLLCTSVLGGDAISLRFDRIEIVAQGSLQLREEPGKEGGLGSHGHNRGSLWQGMLGREVVTLTAVINDSGVEVEV